METSIMTSKGQILVPKRLRRKMNMKPGSRIAFLEKNNEIIIQPLDKAYFEKFAGILSGKGDLIKELMKEKARERKL